MDGSDLPSSSKRPKLDTAVDDLWRKSAPNFLHLLRVMFEKEIHADVTVRVELENTSRIIECHSLVLSAHSPVFSTMISGRWNGDNNNENKKILTLKDDDPDHFHLFVKMMYWDWNEDNLASYEIPDGVTPELAVGVLSLAHKYLATYVIRQAEHLIFGFLSKRLAADTVKLYQLLNLLPICKHGQAGRKTLRTVENCLLADGEDIFLSEAITRLHPKELDAIVQRNDLNCNEETVYVGCLTWAHEQCKVKGLDDTGANMRSVLKKTLKRIRFPLMNKVVISNEVLPENILTQEDVVDLMVYFFKSDCHGVGDNPTNFCTKERRDPEKLLIKRLDSAEVSKDNPVDFSSPRGFTMTLSETMLLTGMAFYCGESTSTNDTIFVQVEILEKKFSLTKVVKKSDINGGKRPWVYISIKPVVQIPIPANVLVNVKFTITGDTKVVFTEVVDEDETRKEISYWDNKAIFFTFGPSPNVPNGLMQVPRLYFRQPNTASDTDSSDSSDSD